MADAAQALQAAAGTDRAEPNIDALEHTLARLRAHCTRDGQLLG